MNKMLPVQLIDKRIQINKVGRLAYKMNFTKFYHATQYFSKDNVIGVGVTGIMYKTTLSNGCIFAAKRLHDSQLCIKRFESEIKILGQYSHRNILPLIGFCIDEEKNERVLVYQYISNGKLSDWLNDDTKTLGWSRVIQIALGIARGLCCLHHSLHMVHLNISSECILLGNTFEPKISNFGGAMFMNNDVNQNIGSGKKDVYDFGCLLFELIKGKKFGQTSDCLSNTNVPFATYTYPNPMNLLEDHFGFYDAVNESLNKIEFEDEVSALLRIACDCIHPLFDKRPTMLEVYSKMGNIWERDDICEDPDLLSVGVPPLKWNDTIAAYARNFVKTKIDTCVMEPSGGPYGENFATFSDNTVNNNE
ncbi:tyrosine kinase family protein [Medicago truncatula]|uniref:Tyrosine kinase family protein n=1 Tax=Medicago truncatula TaxID=3880 RepID=G7JSZ8_MEDTR|nr:tyrosine kinase family protein [Medicago truncatula]